MDDSAIDKSRIFDGFLPDGVISVGVDANSVIMLKGKLHCSIEDALHLTGSPAFVECPVLMICVLSILLCVNTFDLHHIDGVHTSMCAILLVQNLTVDEVRLCHFRLEELTAIEGHA